MKYTMNVVICNPNTPEGMNSDIFFKLNAEFVHNPQQYGNGHYLNIGGEHFTTEAIDLRYDTSFNRNKKKEYLENWAHSYWSGENGAYKVKSLEISEEA